MNLLRWSIVDLCLIIITVICEMDWKYDFRWWINLHILHNWWTELLLNIQIAIKNQTKCDSKWWLAWRSYPCLWIVVSHLALKLVVTQIESSVQLRNANERFPSFDKVKSCLYFSNFTNYVSSKHTAPHIDYASSFNFIFRILETLYEFNVKLLQLRSKTIKLPCKRNLFGQKTWPMPKKRSVNAENRSLLWKMPNWPTSLINYII